MPKETWKSPRKIEEERRQMRQDVFEKLYQLATDGEITWEQAKEAFDTPEGELYVISNN